MLAAARQIGLAKGALFTDAVAIIVLGIITLVVIEVPLLFFLLFPKTGAKAMKPVDNWISSHGNILIAVFLIVIGAYIIFNGLIKLGMT